MPKVNYNKLKEERTVTSSLNIRLINSMVIFALVIIASVTAIQVHNQMSKATDQNLFRSKLSSIIVHQSIDQTVNQALSSGKGRQGLLADFQETLKALVASEAVDEIFIVD